LDSRAGKIYLKFNASLCNGCRACELACSFCLEGICDPSVSKIRIIRNNATGEIFSEIPSSCPQCSFEVQPCCVSFCAIGALTIRNESVVGSDV
jgi:Fe-S-cluster-containing hydrogenase component 2